MLNNFADQRFLILGAGVTGSAVASSLRSRGGLVTITDDNAQDALRPESVDLANFDAVVISPGWRQDHPLVVQVLSSNLHILNEMAKGMDNASRRLVPRNGVKSTAPRVEVVRFHPDRKGDLIGPGGAVLRQLEDRFGGMAFADFQELDIGEGWHEQALNSLLSEIERKEKIAARRGALQKCRIAADLKASNT